MTTAGFDGRAYKETTREQWQRAADAWHRWGPTIERWTGDATELMLDVAKVGPGTRVLDIAAGAGGQSLAAARRGASVVATDLAPAILEFAATEARAAGFEIKTLVVDGEALRVDPGSFEAVISRLGYMYFPDKVRALRSAAEALRPGGRIAAIGFTAPERNAFFSVPIGIVRRRAKLPPPAPGLPGPFSLANGAAEAALAEAGFVAIESHPVAAPLRLKSAAECTRFERESFGALHQMLSGLTAAEQDDAWAEIEGELGRFEGPDGFVGPCELLVVGAMRG